MSGGFTADTDGLRTAAGGFDLVGDEAVRLAQTLSSAQSAEHQSWGSDEAGTAFAEKYLPHLDTIDTTIDDLREVLQSVRSNVIAIADALAQTDGSIGDVFGSVDPDDGDSGTGMHCWPTNPGSTDEGRPRPGGPVGGGWTGTWPSREPGIAHAAGDSRPTPVDTQQGGSW